MRSTLYRKMVTTGYGYRFIEALRNDHCALSLAARTGMAVSVQIVFR